jgi:hypothetical protein
MLLRAAETLATLPKRRNSLPVDNQKFTPSKWANGKHLATPGRATFGRQFEFGHHSWRAGAARKWTQKRKQPPSALGKRRADAVGKYGVPAGFNCSKRSNCSEGLIYFLQIRATLLRPQKPTNSSARATEWFRLGPIPERSRKPLDYCQSLSPTSRRCAATGSRGSICTPPRCSKRCRTECLSLASNCAFGPASGYTLGPEERAIAARMWGSFQL